MKKLMTKKKQRKSMKVPAGSPSRSAEALEGARADDYGKVSPETHLRRILSDRELASFYKRFLDSKYCGEILSFWLAVEEYKRQRDFSKAAEVIVCKFLTRGAENEVNLDMDVHMAEVRGKIAAGADKHLFDKLQRAAFQLQVHDSYPKFMASKHYRDYLGGLELHPPLTRTASVEHLYRYCARAEEREQAETKDASEKTEQEKTARREQRKREKAEKRRKEKAALEEQEDRVVEEDPQEIRMVVSMLPCSEAEPDAGEVVGNAEEEKDEAPVIDGAVEEPESTTVAQEEGDSQQSRDDSAATAAAVTEKNEMTTTPEDSLVGDESEESDHQNGETVKERTVSTGEELPDLESASEPQEKRACAEQGGTAPPSTSETTEEASTVVGEQDCLDGGAKALPGQGQAQTAGGQDATVVQEQEVQEQEDQGQESGEEGAREVEAREQKAQEEMNREKAQKQRTSELKAQALKVAQEKMQGQRELEEAEEGGQSSAKPLLQSMDSAEVRVIKAPKMVKTSASESTIEQSSVKEVASNGSIDSPRVAIDSPRVAGDVSQKKIITVVVSLQKRLLALETKEAAHQKREKELIAVIDNLTKRLELLEERL